MFDSSKYRGVSFRRRVCWVAPQLRLNVPSRKLVNSDIFSSEAEAEGVETIISDNYRVQKPLGTYNLVWTS